MSVGLTREMEKVHSWVTASDTDSFGRQIWSNPIHVDDVADVFLVYFWANILLVPRLCSGKSCAPLTVDFSSKRSNYLDFKTKGKTTEFDRDKFVKSHRGDPSLQHLLTVVMQTQLLKAFSQRAVGIAQKALGSPQKSVLTGLFDVALRNCGRR